MAAAGGEVDPALLAELEAEGPLADASLPGLEAETRARLTAVLEELEAAKARLDHLLAARTETTDS